MELRERIAGDPRCHRQCRDKLPRSGQGRPAAAAAIAVFVLSLTMLVGASFFEYVLKLAPCPLCLEQRIPYHVIVPLSLLLGIAALARAPRKLLLVGFAAIAIAAGCNIVLGIYHAGVEWHWWAGPADCSGPLTDLQTGGRSMPSSTPSTSCAATRQPGVFSGCRSPATMC